MLSRIMAGQVGLLDLDIHGPNIPKMLGLEDHQLSSEDNKDHPGAGDRFPPGYLNGISPP